MTRFAPSSKYKAQKAIYGGESYDSRAEAAYASLLTIKPEVLSVVRQPKFTLGCPENVYRGDFLILAVGYAVVDDVKGTETPAFKKVRRLWAKYGTLPLRIVRLKLRYPKVEEGEEPPLPTIKGVDYEVIHGGRDRRVYGPLHPEWLRK